MKNLLTVMLLSSLFYGVALGKIRPYDCVFLRTVTELVKLYGGDHKDGKR
ncbi:MULTISPECIES: hypothetical protein [unclassified Microcystis]|nr:MULTISPECIES: hypothetical protein [unclassified Microcystis]MCA2515820.1 hypothetical protein [Microcystis sp. M59BS1]MCA2563274.1 hypothetical protein [Microcystis sp. M40BS1]MCA2588823.1 hypothetical protein [Microcystis sp. M34BS1]